MLTIGLVLNKQLKCQWFYKNKRKANLVRKRELSCPTFVNNNIDNFNQFFQNLCDLYTYKNHNESWNEAE